MPKPNFAGATIRAEHNLEVMRGMNSACVDLGAAPPLWMRHPVGLTGPSALFRKVVNGLSVGWLGSNRCSVEEFT